MHLKLLLKNPTNSMKLQMKLQGFDGKMPKGKYIAPEKKNQTMKIID